MLTIKLVEHNGHEQIHEVKTVQADPGDKQHETNVVAWKPDGEVMQFGNYGVLYVMNEAGSTVAKYFLGYGEDRSGKEPEKAAA